MRITQCDSCHAKVNDYAHWYNNEKPRNMYELKCVHESNSDTFDGMIFCHKCIEKLLYGAEQDELYDFARWVAEEIFDDNWEYNKDGFAELACRKLAKLGIVRAKDNEWELIEPQESEE